MNRVLVTGASGFIGCHCLALLAPLNYEVHAVCHFGQPVAGPNVEWHSANLLDGRELARLIAALRPTHLMHLAWYADPRDYRTSPENLTWLQASIELLRCFSAAGGKRAVLAGTCFEYDSRFGYCTEGVTPEAPTTLYAVCKNSLREVVARYSADIGVSVAWGRIFYLFGAHEPTTRLVPSVILSLLRGGRAACTQGRQLRDFLYVEDVASALVAILDSGIEGIVNVGSGEPVTVRSLVEQIASIIHARDRIDFGVIQPVVNDPSAVIANTGRLRQEVGWSARWSLKDGLAQTVEWWRGQLFGPHGDVEMS